MNKPQQLRELLSNAVPQLANDPDKLHIFVDEGKIVATTVNNNLSFEYQFDCVVIVTDYNQHADTLMVPILGWLALHQPELLNNPDLREKGFKFKAELINHNTCDIEITLALTERVKVTNIDNQVHIEHLPEPQDPYDDVDWTLYTDGVEVPWPQT